MINRTKKKKGKRKKKKKKNQNQKERQEKMTRAVSSHTNQDLPNPPL